MLSALIWGASGGIGSELVRQLKNKGWTVYAVARQEGNIPTEADYTYPFDASDPYSIQNAALLIAQETEGVDLVIYAAGGVRANPLHKTDPDDWSAVMAANLDGAYLTARSSLNLLNKGGQMMFIGAYVHKITMPRMGAYVTAKAGLESLFTVLQKENRKIKMTLVRPPAVDTPFWENAPFKLPDGAMKPAQVAEAMLNHYATESGGELDL